MAIRTQPTPKPALRWWQVLCRLGALVLFVLSAAYATLPWWAPTDYLRRRIAARLAEQMGVEVRVGAMRLSWFDGVEIRDLTIYSTPRFGSALLATVGSIRTELSPVEVLLHRRIAWMELLKPRIYVRVDADGNVNLSPLTRLRRDLAVDRVNVYQGHAALKLAGDPRVLTLKVPSLQLDSGRLREITMSAALVQSGDVGEAPVSLSPGAWSDPTVAASASLTFSNVDLSQLPLAAIGALPVRRLSGRCDGSLDLKVDHDGVVESFSSTVRIRHLDVQPAGGMKLPVIDEAGFRVSAAYDHLTRALRLRSASVRLPGIDLTGQANVFTEALGGHWEAVESMDFEGTLYPGRLAALLTGKRRLGGDLAVAGPVAVTVSCRHQGTKLRLRLAADATGAEVRRKTHVLKPAGRPCRMGLSGDLDHRTSAFIVNESWLDLAGNRFSGHGALLSLRRLARRLSGKAARGGAAVLLAELGRLNWRGSWEIHDWPALLDLVPAAGRPDVLRDVALRGPLTGRWFLHHAPATRVHVSFHAASETALAVGRHFVKPTDRPLHLDIDAAIDANHAALNDLDLALTVGAARLAIDRANLTFGTGKGEAGELSGRVTAERLDELLECLPEARGSGAVRGDLVGRFAVRTGPDRRVRLSADLKDVHLALAPWFDKPAGQPAQVHLDLRAPVPDGPASTKLLACTWTCPYGELTVNGTLRDSPRSAPPAGRPLPIAARWPGEIDWLAEAVVKDAGDLAAASPVLARLLGKATLAGRGTLVARGRLHPGSLDANALLDATGLAYASAAPGGRRKAAGTKLSLRLDARLDRESDALVARVRSGELHFAGSRLSWRGSGKLVPAAAAEGKKRWPPPGLAGFQVDANASVAIDRPLSDLAPEWEALARRHGLTGRLDVRSTVRFDGNSFDVAARLDATSLGAADLLGASPASARSVKPAGMPAELDLAITAPKDLSHVRVRNLRLRLGEAHVVADASADLALGDDGLPAKVGRIAAHVAASTARLEALAALCPPIRPYGLSGGAFLDVDLTDVAGGVVSCATVRFDHLRANLRGMAVGLNGELLIEKLTPRRGLSLKGPIDPNDPQWGRLLEENIPEVGRLGTDGLEFRAGTSHGWLLADLAGLPHKPRGSFHLLAERLDLQELTDWASPAKAPAGTRRSRPAWKLSEPQLLAVRARARELAATARKHLLPARIDGRVSVHHLRSYDVSVDQVYDVRRLELTASVADGQVKVAYAGGLNGGLLHDRYSTDLRSPNPPVTCQSVLRNVLGEKNIQPQLAKFFPGNTVYGTFSRQETVSLPLETVLAGALDGRVPRRPIGRGKTVAIDGLTQGRAAPKFMTNIFPGLNLAKYRYRRMTSFAEFLPGGTAKNDMVFSGKTYDLYMEGTTDAENIGRYEIGLILLGTPQSAEWNHTYRQGRIPILNFKARIEGGKMYDEEVSYLWPNETLFVIFLKNNIFYRIWLAAGKNRGR